MKGPHDSLTTERLTLRRFTAADLDLLLSLHSDPEVTRYVGGNLSPAQCEIMLRERILDYYESCPGFGIWVTVERATGERVGMHLLNHIRGEPLIQVGYLLLRAYWGRGFATEMAARVLHYGFVDLGLPQIAGITEKAHIASQHVLLKVGLERRGERVFPAYGSTVLAWFERDASSWLAAPPLALTRVVRTP